jgi:L-ascorbate metabolism protein UlaG (beta-lactamase superfamily)
MRITHLGHACLLVEIADARILVDPGTIAPDWDEVTDLDAVVITHQHPDHLDLDRLPGLLSRNPDVPVLADSGSVEAMANAGIPAAVRAPEGTTVGEVRLTPVGELHALIHEEIPRIPNLGVRFDAEGEPSLYVPGDSLEGEPGDVDVLAFPLAAPWCRSREMTAFLRRFNAPVAVPVHDGILSAAGRPIYLGQARSLGGADTEVRDLLGAGPVAFAAP